MGAVQWLGRERAGAAADLLGAAFSEYPVLRYVLGAEHPDYDRALAALIRFFVEARLLRDEPVLAVPVESGLGAVALVSYPDGPASASELAVLREKLWSELGGAARARYEAFGAACQPLIHDVPRIHLNMIGVGPGHQGRGLGRRLLEAVHTLARERPASQGISLTTEDPGNVPLYRRFGYEITGRAAFGPGLETWALFRPARPEAREGPPPWLRPLDGRDG